MNNLGFNERFDFDNTYPSRNLDRLIEGSCLTKEYLRKTIEDSSTYCLPSGSAISLASDQIMHCSDDEELLNSGLVFSKMLEYFASMNRHPHMICNLPYDKTGNFFDYLQQEHSADRKNSLPSLFDLSTYSLILNPDTESTTAVLFETQKKIANYMSSHSINDLLEATEDMKLSADSVQVLRQKLSALDSSHKSSLKNLEMFIY